MYTFKLKDTL